MVAGSGRSELVTEAADAECWLCGERGCDCEASIGVQCEDSCSAPVTPEQRTAILKQVTPERTDGAKREFNLGPTTIGGKNERAVGTQTTEEPAAADKE